MTKNVHTFYIYVWIRNNDTAYTSYIYNNPRECDKSNVEAVRYHLYIIALQWNVSPIRFHILRKRWYIISMSFNIHPWHKISKKLLVNVTTCQKFWSAIIYFRTTGSHISHFTIDLFDIRWALLPRISMLFYWPIYYVFDLLRVS